ncbi:MAG: hypothetical protein HYX69_19700 [Planctomycetia bacterium]|nr:hypothetical protein [Planctomycetia bacterium]
MSPSWYRRPVVWLAAGVLIGIVAAGFWPHAQLHAVATDHTDNFTIATGPVDDELEAIFFLDFLTGTLKAAVISTSTGKFTALFETSVLNDLGITQGQNPRYLMITGVAGLRRSGAGLQPGTSVVYVAEVGSGKVAAYAIPWNRGQATAVQPFKGALYRLDVLQFRNTPVRGQ